MKFTVDWEVYETSDQHELICQLAKELKGKAVIKDMNKFVNDVFQREQMASTVITKNLAIPHVRSSNVVKGLIQIVKLKSPLTSWGECQGIDRLILTAVPEAMSPNEQQQCEQFFSELGNPAVLQLFSNGNQEEIIRYISGKR